MSGTRLSRLADWIPGSDLRRCDVRSELAAIEAPLQCIYGAGESTTICPMDKSGSVSGERVGSDHFWR
jgi:type IV secretory pathway VirJ component